MAAGDSKILYFYPSHDFFLRKLFYKFSELDELEKEGHGYSKEILFKGERKTEKKFSLRHLSK